MKLIYRGVTYKRNPSELVASSPFQSVCLSKTPYNLIYRGVTYTVDPSAKQTKFPTKSVTHKLIYRGATYLVTRNV